MRPQKLIISILAFLVSFSGVAALELTHKVVQDEIGYNNEAVYTLYVKNEAEVGDTFRLRPSNLLWGEITFDQPVVDVFSGQVEPVTLRIRPPANILRGTYDIEITAVSNTNPSVQAKDILRLYITSELPHLGAEFGILNAFEPGEESFNIIAKNTGTTSLAGLTAKVESPLLPKAEEVNLGSLDAGKAFLAWSKSFEIPSNTPVGLYDFKFTIFQDGEQISKFIKKVQILGKGKVTVDEQVYGGFLSGTHAVTLTNLGNIPDKDYYEINLPSWKRYFVHSEPEARVTKLGNTAELAWPYDLDVGNNTRVVYTLSYVPLLALVISVLIMLYAAGWYFRQEFSISKEVLAEEGAKALKVQLSVRNHAPLAQNNIVIEDLVPTPFKLAKEFATLAPSAIRKEAGKMKLIWKIGTIYPGEERILTYSLRSALPLLGNIVLPEAKVRAKLNNKAKQFYSNRVSVRARGVKVLEAESE